MNIEQFQPPLIINTMRIIKPCRYTILDVKHTSIITEAEEERLWEMGILGCETPKALVRSVFFLNGKNLCLRGGQEHRDLRMLQFVREVDHWKYIEAGSKNFRGGIADLRRENKVVRQYPCSALGKRCHVYLLDLYMERLPPEAKEKNAFYFTPLQIYPPDKGKPWFSAMPIGRNTLDRLMKTACLEAGLEGKTNHSLRATGAT